MPNDTFPGDPGGLHPNAVTVALANEQEGTAVTNLPVDPRADLLKRIAAGLVGLATVGLAVFPEHTVAFKVCTVFVGIGAALGIRSQGVGK